MKDLRVTLANADLHKGGNTNNATQFVLSPHADDAKRLNTFLTNYRNAAFRITVELSEVTLHNLVKHGEGDVQEAELELDHAKQRLERYKLAQVDQKAQAARQGETQP